MVLMPAVSCHSTLRSIHLEPILQVATEVTPGNVWFIVFQSPMGLGRKNTSARVSSPTSHIKQGSGPPQQDNSTLEDISYVPNRTIESAFNTLEFSSPGEWQTVHQQGEQLQPPQLCIPHKAHLYNSKMSPPSDSQPQLKRVKPLFHPSWDQHHVLRKGFFPMSSLLCLQILALQRCAHRSLKAGSQRQEPLLHLYLR